MPFDSKSVLCILIIQPPSMFQKSFVWLHAFRHKIFTILKVTLSKMNGFKFSIFKLRANIILYNLSFCFIEDDIRKIQHLKMYANFNDYAISVSVMFTIFSSSSQTILSFREVLKSLMIRERNFGNGNRYNQATF